MLRVCVLRSNITLRHVCLTAHTHCNVQMRKHVMLLFMITRQLVVVKLCVDRFDKLDVILDELVSVNVKS